MLPSLLAAAFSCTPGLAAAATLAHLIASPAATAAIAAQPIANEKPLRALDAWLRLYRAGKIDFRSDDNIGKDSIAVKFGIAPKSGLGHPTWAGDLDAILEAVVALDTPEAAQAVLEVAAVGIDQGKYEWHHAPYDVRDAGEKWATKLASAAAREHFAKAARGEVKSDKQFAVAMQTAGVRCLGRLRDPAHRSVLEQALGDGDEIVRVSAAEALAALGDEEAAPALAALLDREQVDAVLVAAAQALRAIYAKYLPKAGGDAPPAAVIEPSPDKPGDTPAAGASAAASGEASGAGTAPAAAPTPAAAPAPAAAAARADLPESLRLAVRGAIRALGRTTWRADMALVSFLDDFRSLETVPALIAVLERFKMHPEELKSGKLSGLLLYQAHELLVSMTGAVYAADQPELWRTFWDTEKDKIVVTSKRDPATAGAPKTVASGFCGIPVQGTRAVFVLDLSGSMDWPMDEVGTDGKKQRSIRLDFAKRELCRAIDAISPNAQFNLITFNGNPKAEAWRKDLAPATERNRDALKKYVNAMRAIGGTNLWSGLEEALKIKSLVYGNRYTTNIDELFVVSDGAPTVGDVKDPLEILRLVQECNKFAQVRINTIFISSATPAEARQAEPRMAITPQELMRRMAEQNGGKFREL